MCVTYSGVFARCEAIYVFCMVHVYYVLDIIYQVPIYAFFMVYVCTCNIHLVLRIMYDLRFLWSTYNLYVVLHILRRIGVGSRVWAFAFVTVFTYWGQIRSPPFHYLDILGKIHTPLIYMICQALRRTVVDNVFTGWGGSIWHVTDLAPMFARGDVCDKFLAQNITAKLEYT